MREYYRYSLLQHMYLVSSKYINTHIYKYSSCLYVIPCFRFVRGGEKWKSNTYPPSPTYIVAHTESAPVLLAVIQYQG